jgi:hypothetical protein
MLAFGFGVALAGTLSLNDPARPYAVELTAEVGFLAPIAHTIQFGSEGDELDYVKDGGQDNLFPAFRPAAALRWRRQTFTLLWQPLDLRSTVTLPTDLRVDDITFPANRPIDLRYGFSFWRLSWGHRLVNRGDLELSIGLGLQIRNATIGFTSVDGTLSEVNRDIGPVPLLEFEIRKAWSDGGRLEAEADGFWAPVKYLNGRDVDVEGAILDAQLRAGLALGEPTTMLVGVRYLGGGGQGTGTPDGTGDGYTANWLHFVIVSVIARVR